jgi:hypothetical protein
VAGVRRSCLSRVWVIAVALAACVCVHAPAAAAALPRARPTRILLVYGVSPELPEVAGFTTHLRTLMRRDAGRTVEFYQEYLDLDRFPNFGPRLVGYFADKYRDVQVDAVVAIGSAALRFSVLGLRGALPGVPIVFVLSNDSQLAMRLPSEGVTGRFSPYPYTATLDLAQRLQPDAEQVAIIGGVSKFDSVAVQTAVKAVQGSRYPLSIIMLQGLSYRALLDRLAHLPARTIALTTSFREDQAGQRFLPGELVAEISRVSAAPVYGSIHTELGQGLVGGAFVLPDAEAVAADELIMRVIRRRPGERLPPPVFAPAYPMADWRQLRRWHLDESRLPPATHVIFRTRGIWERYRAAILISLGLIAVEAGLIALLLV